MAVARFRRSHSSHVAHSFRVVLWTLSIATFVVSGLPWNRCVAEENPQSIYRFDEAPADALALITGLRDGKLRIQLTADEQSLFADAGDGEFDDWSFAEAALLASGVHDKTRRQRYLQQIKQYESDAREAVARAESDFERADQLLQWMHSQDGPFRNGYVAQQTDVSKVLDEQTFNCVSSAVLYNIIGRRLGLNLRAVEVPDHAFSRLYTDESRADVETTNRHGFNPAGREEVRQAIEAETGFRYVGDRERDLRREINAVQLVALIYYNHGVTRSKEQQFQAALVDYFRAMSMDRHLKSAVKNALACMVNWGNQLAADEDFESAIEIIEMGLKLAESDKSLNHNHQVVYTNWARHTAETDDVNHAIQILRQALARTGSERFVTLQAWVYCERANRQAAAGNWRVALQTVDTGLATIDREALPRLRSWKAACYLRWSNDAIDRDNYAEALDVLLEGNAAFPENAKLRDNLAFLAQEWGKHLNDNESAARAREKLIELKAQFPHHNGIASVGSNFVKREFMRLRDAGELPAALTWVEASQGLLSSPSDVAKLTRNAYDNLARRDMQTGDWQAAIEWYARGLQAMPSDRLFRQNLVYCVQEWCRASTQTNGDSETRQILQSQLKRFGDISGVRDVAENWVRDRAEPLVHQQRFAEAWQRLELDRGLLSESAEIRHARWMVDRWSRSLTNDARWKEAVEVYATARKRYPSDQHLTRNATATWHAWARRSMEAEDWETAVEIYQLACEQLPNQRSLRQNLAYCQKAVPAAPPN